MKFALIALGNEESYGLLFVGGELKRLGQKFKYFDGETDIFNSVFGYNPDFICFSPMSTFYKKAKCLFEVIKVALPKVKIVFGGHHAIANPNIINDGIDAVVVGPVRGVMERIINGERGIIHSPLTTPDDLVLPAREEYYIDIPRMRNRYRKFMLSMFGCPWNCSYCSSSSSHIKDLFGAEAQKRYYLSRRPLDIIIAEAKDIIKNPTEEIEWVDDDIFYGKDVEEWLPKFVERWKREISKPIYVSTTSLSILKASELILEKLQPIVSVVGMGIQAIRPTSLRLFNRHWDSEKQMQQAFNRLENFGYKVNMQAIVGLPVPDPVEDALDTIKGLQRIGAGSIVSVYPLIIYSGTAMERYCKEHNIELNPLADGDTNSGIPSIFFSDKEIKQLRNISKLSTFFVKYNIDNRWMRALIETDLNKEASYQISMGKYYECMKDRLPDKANSIFEKVISTMKLRY
jgi:radical SAM superfamily enzyme YgiQ (UPF0313 family)